MQQKYSLLEQSILQAMSIAVGSRPVKSVRQLMSLQRLADYVFAFPTKRRMDQALRSLAERGLIKVVEGPEPGFARTDAGRKQAEDLARLRATPRPRELLVRTCRHSAPYMMIVVPLALAALTFGVPTLPVVVFVTLWAGGSWGAVTAKEGTKLGWAAMGRRWAAVRERVDSFTIPRHEREANERFLEQLTGGASPPPPLELSPAPILDLPAETETEAEPADTEAETEPADAETEESADPPKESADRSTAG